MTCTTLEKLRENSALLVLSQHFSRVLRRHSVLYYCLETRVMLFYSLTNTEMKKNHLLIVLTEAVNAAIGQFAIERTQGRLFSGMLGLSGFCLG